MSWDELLAIFQESATNASEAASARPVACPHDGTPLEENSEGSLNCPMGDYRYE